MRSRIAAVACDDGAQRVANGLACALSDSPVERRVMHFVITEKGNIMFGILGDLTKAVVGVVVETPIAIAADVLTLGGSITDKNEPYTATALKGVMKNVENATKPELNA